jgi:uncharacterized membrane protein
MLVLLLGLVVFLGSHLMPAATTLHDRLVARFGPNTYKLLFSAISLVGLALVIWGYGMARAEGPVVLYDPPTWLRHIVLLLMLPVFVLAAAAYLPGRISAAVRHPLITAVKLWAFAHLLANGDAASVLLFAGFLAWGVIDRISLKRREAAGRIVIPRGPVRNDFIAIGLGLLVYAAFVAKLHTWLIGVPVV